MTDSNLKFGSPEWLEWVFKSPDAREVWGRSRPTQRYGIAGANGRPTYAEGGNEATARSLMILGKAMGRVRRWKFQPFSMTEKLHGCKATPDLLFETTDGKIYVAEPRSARYLTPEKLERAKAVEEAINATRVMRYLFWTDAWPLVPATTRMVRELRRCGTAAIPRNSIDQLRSVLATGPKTFFELRDQAIYRDVVMGAVWHGHAHINLFEDIVDSTLVSDQHLNRRFDDLLCAPVTTQTFWTQLKTVGNPTHPFKK